MSCNTLRRHYNNSYYPRQISGNPLPIKKNDYKILLTVINTELKIKTSIIFVPTGGTATMNIAV